jgi:hypothetical protein
MKRSINWGWWRIADGSRMNLLPAYPKEMIPVNRVLMPSIRDAGIQGNDRPEMLDPIVRMDRGVRPLCGGTPDGISCRG